MNIQPDPAAHQWMVVVAHPGHELRVLDFIARTSPLVAVLTDGSASTGRSRLEQTTALFEFDLVGHPDGGGDGIRLRLDEGPFARKLDAIRRYTELAGEAQAAFDAYGVDAFRTEFLRRARPTSLGEVSEVRYYERVGDERVRQGRYASVLRYGAHVRPVMAALLEMCAAGAHATPLDPSH
jgi:hypothetical protein